MVFTTRLVNIQYEKLYTRYIPIFLSITTVLVGAKFSTKWNHHFHELPTLSGIFSWGKSLSQPGKKVIALTDENWFDLNVSVSTENI